MFTLLALNDIATSSAQEELTEIILFVATDRAGYEELLEHME